MRLSPATARERFVVARVARLATVDDEGAPHLVPVVLAVGTGADADTIYTAVDAKPKRTTALRRLANIAAEPRVTLLVDHYADDWSTLWWVRADGEAQVLEVGSAPAEHGLHLLVDRYPQYRAERPPGPVLAVAVHRWSGWAATPP